MRIDVRKAVTVNRSPGELYRFWRHFENLPRFMRHVEEVRQLDGRRSRWKAKAPLGQTVEWEAELTEEREAELLAWRSVEGADVEQRGSVQFTLLPANRGTEVRVALRYDPPGGRLGALAATLFGEEPDCTAIHRPDCLAIPICSADMRAGRRNWCACRMPMSGR